MLHLFNRCLIKDFTNFLKKSKNKKKRLSLRKRRIERNKKPKNHVK
jgi:hypothetical protein